MANADHWRLDADAWASKEGVMQMLGLRKWAHILGAPEAVNTQVPYSMLPA